MTPVRMDRVESGVRSIIAFTEAFNRHDLPTMLDLLSDDCILETSSPPPDGAVYRGKAALSQFWQDCFKRWPNAHIKIEETAGFGLRCIVRWRCDWMDASSQPTHLRGVDLFRVQNGLIAEHFSYVKG